MTIQRVTNLTAAVETRLIDLYRNAAWPPEVALTRAAARAQVLWPDSQLFVDQQGSGANIRYDAAFLAALTRLNVTDGVKVIGFVRLQPVVRASVAGNLTLLRDLMRFAVQQGRSLLGMAEIRWGLTPGSPPALLLAARGLLNRTVETEHGLVIVFEELAADAEVKL